MSWSGGFWRGGNPLIIDQLQRSGSQKARIATIDHTVELKISQYVQEKLKMTPTADMHSKPEQQSRKMRRAMPQR